jgi:hypothetical protein
MIKAHPTKNRMQGKQVSNEELRSDLGVRLRWCEAAEDAQRYAGRWQTASMLLPSGSKTKAP